MRGIESREKTNGSVTRTASTVMNFTFGGVLTVGNFVEMSMPVNEAFGKLLAASSTQMPLPELEEVKKRNGGIGIMI